MMKLTRRRMIVSAIILALVAVGPVGVSREPANTPQPSQFAPLADLERQVAEMIEDIADDLEDPQEYGEDQQQRVRLNANTLIVIAQTAGQHDESGPLRNSAPALLEAAEALAENVSDFDAANESVAQLKSALQSGEGDPVDWEPRADLQALMQHVPIINNSLRRAVMSRRFERMIDKSASYAATLAAIARASEACTDYCSDEEDEQKWAAVCREMRDAATAVNQAVKEKDKAAATEGLARLVKTCDQCHDSFR